MEPNVEPWTLNVEPWTLNVEPWTLNVEPWTLNVGTSLEGGLRVLFLAFAIGAGGSASTEIAIPHFEFDATIDGVLDEPVWANAALLNRFSQYLPVDGRPAEDSTIVRVWYSPTAIHFGITAFEIHGSVQSTLADRDKIQSDDHIHILLDTFNDQRQAFLFSVNPLGVQADGILRDAARSASSFGGGNGRTYAIDLSQDYVYESAGRLTSHGYVVEIRIPFKSLRYQSAATQNWGINIIRRVQHSGYENTWSPVFQADPSFLAKSGQLAGLTNLQRGLVLDLNPELTSSVLGSPATPAWNYDTQRPELGGNVRWGITNNLFLNGTVNPDFSQVEADVAQVQFDPRRSLFFPEKRPFFLDGLEQFSTPNRLIYTRRLANPVGAVKLSGKISNTNIAVLSGFDDRAISVDESRPIFNWVRMQRDVLGQSTLGFAYTDKVDGNDYNRVAAADARLVLGPYTMQFQGGGSSTRTSDQSGSAPIWMATVSRAGRRFGFTSSVTGIHPDFEAGSGFISRGGIVHANIQPRITFFGAPGASLESWTGSVTLDGTWDYHRFFAARTPNDSKLHVNGMFTFRGGWSIATSLLIESFKYPEALYADYFIEMQTPTGLDTIPYTGTNRLNNLDLVLNISTPQFPTFSANAFLVYGRDENFFEWAGADIVIGTLTANWIPTEQLRVNLRYNHTQFIRPGERTNVGLRRIPRLKIEYQLSRAIFFRVVGQYDANFVDALKDASRTENPILIHSPGTDSFSRAVATTTNDFRVDWLFSFRPNPGTVVFLGYGASLYEPESFRFRSLERANDAFFAKLSYLWRM